MQPRFRLVDPKTGEFVRPDANTIAELGRVPPPGWEQVFYDCKEDFEDIDIVLRKFEPQLGPSFPVRREIFEALWLTPLDNVKVIIIGQDPYPQWCDTLNCPRAMGLSFSVRRGDEIPVSLRNIFSLAERTVPGFVRPDHGDLTGWAKQGVLLLNNALTVPKDLAGAYSGVEFACGTEKKKLTPWTGVVRKILKSVIATNPKVAIVLWGGPAQKLAKDLGSAKLFIGAHPASRNGEFYNQNVFNEINDWLIKNQKEAINWTQL
jgi:uracil-DNA glycosylase